MVDHADEQAISRTGVGPLASHFLSNVLGRKEETTSTGRPKRTRRTALPWELWELDETFLEALSKWTLDNPETSLDRVLDNVCDGLENSKDLFQLIPDNPFPARGLVIALAHLFKLGVKVSRAKREVLEFAKDVVRWVEVIRISFQSLEDGHFTWQASRNLKDMRDIINEICSWAVDRLEDGRWSRITHGLMVQKEIQEFRDRIADARSLFWDVSAINQAKGLDAIMQNFIYLFQGDQITFAEIQKIREMQDKHFDEIMSELEMQKQVAERDRFFAQTLNVRTVANPTYDSQGKRPCDEDTRQEVLDDIRKWINDVGPGTPNFLWLTGDPGCGKSAVTASLARECKDEGVLWAQFFINRNNSETTDPRSYFPSIARQLADYSPQVAKTIHQTLEQQRSLVDDISADQAAKLFAHSIRKASQIAHDRPVVVVIDGLDETRRDRLEDTASIFSTLFATLHAHSNVKVFISSRTDNEIQKSFVPPSNEKHVKRIHLDTAHTSSIRDVSQYIKRNLLELVKKHDLNWDVWPGDKRSQALGARAAGLFIWAVTAIKFIQERLQSDGQECLNDLLDLLTADVLYDINALYMLILRVTHGAHPTDWELERFRRIIGAIVSLQEPLCIDDLAALLDLRKTPSSTPVDVPHFVRRFRTILVTGTDVIDGNTVPRIHKSVYEFITSDVVEMQFRVDPGHAHLELGLQCLAYLGAAQPLDFKDKLPMSFRYASRFWPAHISQSKAIGPLGVCADYRCSSPTLSLSQFVQSVNFSQSPMRVHYSASTSEIKTKDRRSYVWDATTGDPISHHTARISGMIFSPDGKQIVSCSHDKTICCWDSVSGQWIRTLLKYSSALNAIAFSPDGEFIISGSDDHLVCRWDYTTGAPMGEPFRGHKGRVTCVAFARDGKQIISGSEDNTCILWNARNGQVVGKPWAGHNSPVRQAVFSASGRRVCSVDDKGFGFIWDVGTEQKVKSWKYGGSYPMCISFSPQSDDIIAVGGGEGVEIRHHNQTWSIPDSYFTNCLSFSTDGEHIGFGTSNAVSVAEISDEPTTRIIRKGDYDRPDLVYLATLSPNFDSFSYADLKNEIHVYTMQQNGPDIKMVSVDEEICTASNNNGHEDLKDSLSSCTMRPRHDYEPIANNRHLNVITWYEAKAVAEFAVKLWVVRDDMVIAGYKDGSISAWKINL